MIMAKFRFKTSINTTHKLLRGYLLFMLARDKGYGVKNQ
jgi:hypothetical protein